MKPSTPSSSSSFSSSSSTLASSPPKSLTTQCSEIFGPKSTMMWFVRNWKHPQATEATKKWFRENNITYEGKWVFEKSYTTNVIEKKKERSGELFQVPKVKLQCPSNMLLSIAESKILASGQGVFVDLRAAIEDNRFLGVYAGRVIEDSGQQFVYSVQMRCWGVSVLVDAKREGNEFRYLQNSHQPNVEIRDVQVEDTELSGSVPGVFSLLPIRSGRTELVTVYSSFPNQTDHFQNCHCNSPKCTKFQSIRDPIFTSDYIHKTSPYQAVSTLSSPCTTTSPLKVIPYFSMTESPVSNQSSTLPFHKTGTVFSSSPLSPHTSSSLSLCLLNVYTLTAGHYYYIDCSSLSFITGSQRLHRTLLLEITIARFLALVTVQNTYLAMFQVSKFWICMSVVV